MKAMKVKPEALNAGKAAKCALGAMKVAMKGTKKAADKVAMKVIKKEPKAKATKPATENPHYMSRKDAKCPKVGDGPVDYKQGRIYTSAARTAFRVIRLRGVFNTERQFRCAKKGKTDKKALMQPFRLSTTMPRSERRYFSSARLNSFRARSSGSGF